MVTIRCEAVGSVRTTERTCCPVASNRSRSVVLPGTGTHARSLAGWGWGSRTFAPRSAMARVLSDTPKVKAWNTAPGPSVITEPASLPVQLPVVVEGPAVHSAAVLRQTALEFQNLHWLRVGFNAAGSVLIFVGFLKFYRHTIGLQD